MQGRANYSTAEHGKTRRSEEKQSTAQHSTAQHSTAQHSTAQHSTAHHSTAQHSTAQHSTAQHSTAQHSTAQHSTAQHSTAQHSTAQHSTLSAHSQAIHMNPWILFLIGCSLVLLKPMLSVQDVDARSSAAKRSGDGVTESCFFCLWCAQKGSHATDNLISLHCHGSNFFCSGRRKSMSIQEGTTRSRVATESIYKACGCPSCCNCEVCNGRVEVDRDRSVNANDEVRGWLLITLLSPCLLSLVHMRHMFV
jgi:DNA mismatch repair ATPase MutL